MARRFLIGRHELRMGRAELQAVGKGEKRSFLLCGEVDFNGSNGGRERGTV